MNSPSGGRATNPTLGPASVSVTSMTFNWPSRRQSQGQSDKASSVNASGLQAAKTEPDAMTVSIVARSSRNNTRNAASQPVASGISAMLSRSCSLNLFSSRFWTLTAILVCSASAAPRFRSPGGFRRRTGVGLVALPPDGEFIQPPCKRFSHLKSKRSIRFVAHLTSRTNPWGFASAIGAF